MNWSRFTTISVAANVALVGLTVYAVSLLKKVAVEPAPAPRLITSTVTQVAVRKISASNFWATLMASRNPSWALVESTNYVTYIENLRGLGCPEETVQDIIVADIAKLYAKKRAGVRAGKAMPYWKSEEAWNATPEKQEQDAALRALDQEERGLVKQLLGIDLEAELAKFKRNEESSEDAYSYLPAEKHQQILALQEHFAELESQIYAGAKGLLLDEDHEQLRRLEKLKEQELAKVLSPEELEAYQLRTSATAGNLRSQMSSFEASEDEFKQIFRLQKTYDDQFATAFDTTDPQQAQTREKAQAAAQQALNEELKKTLGEKRYAEYQRAQDPDFRSLLQVSERFQLGSDTAQKIYEMKDIAEKQKRAVEANRNLTPEQRSAALEALAQQTRNSVAQTMGGKDSQVWKAFQQTGASWMENLALSETAPAEVVPEQVIPTPPVPPVPFGPPFGPPFVPPPPVPPSGR